MSKILVLNFDITSSFIENCNTLANYLVKNPYYEINVITFSENSNIAESYSNLFQFHFINKDRINKIYNSRLFNDAFAINGFLKETQVLLDYRWDKSIDLTKNNFSSYLHTVIDSNEKIGLSFNDKKFITYSDKAVQIYNDFIIDNSDSLMNKNLINNIQLGLFDFNFIDYKISDKIKTIANRNFAKIRNKVGENINLIGLAINNLNNFQNTCELINKYLTSFDLYPVIIYKASKDTANLIDKINKVFEDSLVCVRYELNALPAILRNLDLVVTHEKTISKFAEGTETPNILITNQINSSISLNPSTCVLQENFRTKINDDIITLTNNLLSNSNNYNNIENEFALSKQEEDSILIRVNFNSGIYNLKNVLTFKNICDFLEISNRIKIETNIAWEIRLLESEKENISNSVKAILNTLRLLKCGFNNHNDVNKFILSLDEIFNLSELNTSIKPMLLKFKSSVERIHENESSKNIKMIEHYLFELKDDLKRVIRELPNIERFQENSL